MIMNWEIQVLKLTSNNSEKLQNSLVPNSALLNSFVNEYLLNLSMSIWLIESFYAYRHAMMALW